VFEKLVRLDTPIYCSACLCFTEIGEDDTRCAQGRDTSPPAHTQHLCDPLIAVHLPLEKYKGIQQYQFKRDCDHVHQICLHRDEWSSLLGLGRVLTSLPPMYSPACPLACYHLLTVSFSLYRGPSLLRSRRLKSQTLLFVNTVVPYSYHQFLIFLVIFGVPFRHCFSFHTQDDFLPLSSSPLVHSWLTL
jgi:hypothetical protein